jgi:hypothetical protein
LLPRTHFLIDLSSCSHGALSPCRRSILLEKGPQPNLLPPGRRNYLSLRERVWVRENL